ncbi:VOC family protein [Kitasatospora sp. NPDC051170]|uniref:VOC family protein n=1 Tax=Kitasatospora sp. NPDC051170 TaxID=3364056 RepID=UPI00379E02EE
MLDTTYRPGAPVWLDLATADTRASADFYTALFGWTHATDGPGTGDYGFFHLHGRTAAALGPLPTPDTPPAWTLHFATADADRTTDLVRHAGGRVRHGPHDVLTAGRTAHCTDPTGADFSVWQPHDTRGLDVVDEPGSLCWTECHSVDAERAKTFYRTVFDWQEHDVPFAGRTFTVLTPAGSGSDDAHGDLVQLDPEDTARGTGSHWLPYFEVPDVDTALATAQHLGATVRAPATDLPGMGRLAQLLDRHGAAFAVITSEKPG